MNIKKTIGTLMMCAITATPMMAQQTSAESYQPCTYQEMEQLTVNEQVTTVITASEPIRFVDISTDKIAGDQPINNTVRLKPKEGMHEDGEVLAIVTIVTERYRTQYALLYTTRLQEAVTDKEIQQIEKNAYNNPAVTLSSTDMARYARQIWSSEAHVNNVKTKAHKMVMRLNNIYSSGDYFFLDFSVENKTDIPFDIDQTIPLWLPQCDSLAIRKMTFPNDKKLTIEMTENQISGLTISLKVNYSDVLSADSFNPIFLK